MIAPMGRLAQWESARLTRERSLVQTQCRPPGVAPSSSGLGRSPLKAEIAGSNPAGATFPIPMAVSLPQQFDHQDFPILAGNDFENLPITHGQFIEEGRQQVAASARIAGVPS